MELFLVFFDPFVRIVSMAIQLYIWVVIARAVISWVNPDPYNPIVRFLYNVTEPVLYQIRRWVPVHFGGIDLTPLILIFGLYLVQMVLLNLLQYLNRLA